MADEKTQEVSQEAPAGENIQISIEQICAAIINTVGSIEVPLENILKDYSGKNIAVNQDEETKSLKFELTDAPIPVEEESTETE